MTFWTKGVLTAAVISAAVTPAPEGQSRLAPGKVNYLREELMDSTVHSDEALVNVRVRASRWPDCTTLGTVAEDILRLEGVGAKSDQDKAMAVWKWHRILMGTAGPGPFEGPAGGERLISDPHKLLAVYGRHHCEGHGKVMAGIWRAAGFMAFDECSYNHTTAALRYRDADGQMRYHTYDPDLVAIWWDKAAGRAGTRSMPVMHGKVYRHLTAPLVLHSLRTSLRVGETVERRWGNGGRTIAAGPDKKATVQRQAAFYAYPPKVRKNVYTVNGEEVETLEARTDPALFASQLSEGSANTACSPAADGRVALHPAKTGEPAAFIYRLASPYPATEVQLEATLRKGKADDVCRLSISRDGKTWLPVFVKELPGEEQVAVELGGKAREAGRPDVYTAYDFFVKAELRTTGDPAAVGLNALKVTAYRMLAKRCLPYMRPGDNYWEINADRLAAGLALELAVNYKVDGKAVSVKRLVNRFPHCFRVDVPAGEEATLKDYDWTFNTGWLQMDSIQMRLVKAGPETRVDDSLPEAEAWPRFAAAYPYPADMNVRRNMPRAETSVEETSGFFPQSHRRIEGPPPADLLDKLRHGGFIEPVQWEKTSERWLAAEELGNYPQAVDALCAELDRADGDLLLFLCKGLAQIGNPKSVAPLLAKWKKAERCQPGSRYIPDALAATGDRSVVPHLIAPLHSVRFDFRLHIAHALGALGGPEAEEALEDLAANDPFPAVRQEAHEALSFLRAGGAPGAGHRRPGQ